MWKMLPLIVFCCVSFISSISVEECHLLGCYAMWLFKNQCFGTRYHLRHQGDKNRCARNVSTNWQPKHASVAGSSSSSSYLLHSIDTLHRGYRSSHVINK
jgi:hypothetical protein